MVDWDDSILVGIPTVDNDHKAILYHINRFIDVVGSRSGIGTIHQSFRNMEACIHRHLAAEERMLSIVGFEETERHVMVHQKLAAELDEIWDDMLADRNFRPDDAARKWLEEWLFGHVKAEDFCYRDWIFDAGLEVKAEEAMKN